MKLITHALISLGATALILTQTGHGALPVLGVGLLTAYLTDQLIDRLGHEQGPHGPRRSWTTHTVLLAQVWGTILGLAVGTAAEQILQPNGLIAAAVTGGLAASTLHLFADSLCEAGIYVPTMNPAHRLKRWHMATLPYNSPALNLTLALLGFLALAYAYFHLLAPA